ncbi:MAG: glutathione S-transferase family protein [Gammaproteobacteria bacterium]|nr:glutathione S-transferase family protein [Gammaproteobacteria bacterium]
MSELILHHYWPSPVAEKVRAFLGFKKADWQSVEIPRVPPKPDVIALTGGYRRTPVLQIGADIYCDSQCILRELERRLPDTPALGAPLQGALVWGLSRWTDGELLTHVIRVVLGSQVDTLDPEFLADRARLYFGSQWSKESMAAGVSRSLDAIGGSFHWMDQALGAHRFLNGDEPGVADALCHYLVWFIHGRYDGGPALLEHYRSLSDWFERTQSFGYGEHTDLSSTAAIEIARSSSPVPTGQSAQSPLVGVVPEGDGGDPEVRGTLVSRSLDEIVIRREDDRAGVVHVHFPAVGYCVYPVEASG